MAKSLHVRDVPDSVHETLVERARSRGISLRRYLIDLLAEHARTPTLDEWLDELARMPPVETRTSAARAVEDSREEDVREVLAGRLRP